MLKRANGVSEMTKNNVKVLSSKSAKRRIVKLDTKAVRSVAGSAFCCCGTGDKPDLS